MNYSGRYQSKAEAIRAQELLGNRVEQNFVYTYAVDIMGRYFHLREDPKPGMGSWLWVSENTTSGLGSML